MGKGSTLDQYRAALAWLVYGLICVWLAIALVWWVFARLDYGYPVFYSVMDIDTHIATYAPANVTRRGFEALGAEEHKAAFSAIRKAVHDHGEGLSQISYRGPAGQPTPLLIPTEVAHLEDVADLLARAFRVSLVVAALWLPLGMATQRLPMPSWRQRAVMASVIALPVVLWLLIAGPKAVFYQWHIWLFPPENPWFFYWEDSLMSTLMKAPYLFGAIAVVLVAGAALLTPLLYMLGRTIVRPIAGGRA